MKHEICPECLGNNVSINGKWEDLAGEKGWKPVKFWLPLIKCMDCDKTYEALEADNAIHDASCKAMGLLTPTEIKSIRKDLNMNAEEFATLLGLGKSTVKRWEARALIPNRSSMKLVKIAATPKGLQLLKNIT